MARNREVCLWRQMRALGHLHLKYRCLVIKGRAGTLTSGEKSEANCLAWWYGERFDEDVAPDSVHKDGTKSVLILDGRKDAAMKVHVNGFILDQDSPLAEEATRLLEDENLRQWFRRELQAGRCVQLPLELLEQPVKEGKRPETAEEHREFIPLF